MPSCLYKYLGLGVGAYVPLAGRFGLDGRFRYLVVGDVGDVGDFGSSWTAWGVAVEVGLHAVVVRHLEVALGYRYERFEMSFQGRGLLGAEAETPPSSGSDAYHGIRLTAGFRL